MIDISNLDNDKIKTMINNIWAACHESGHDRPQEINVLSITKDLISVSVSAQYSAPTFNASHIIKMVEVFQTTNINTDQFSHPGCDTCDYGSNYGITFTIRPSKVK